MTYYQIVTICSQSACIPAVAGALRFTRVGKAYQPFIVLMVLGWLNEILSAILIHYRLNNGVNSNIYVLLEFLCVMYLFRQWQGEKGGAWYKLAGISLTIVWVVENLIVTDLYSPGEVFRVCSAVVVLYFCVLQLNAVVMMERVPILRQPKFYICTGLLVFYFFKALMQCFLVFNIGFSRSFFESFYLILVVVNVITNVIYTTAILWMPTKESYWLRY